MSRAREPKPYAESCDQNRDPILAVIREVYTRPGMLLEIGSGTGQHAVYFARHLPHVQWQPADVAENLPGITAWVEEAELLNVRTPLELDVTMGRWPVARVDAVFSANTVHIMSWPEVQAMFKGLARVMNNDAPFCLYGPFNYHGRYTSESNARFDGWLRARDPNSGIRDVDDLHDLAQAVRLEPEDDRAMPADNRTLVWRRRAG
ncbi:MAG: DUF938 domain-containing protein [Gammaproteobacteria bacterium]|nr:DUF938 domain-containing protein [Gammaproteobacteria bacterium]NIR97167.1 DUF938 domain-containing protein [Gammaproteobacteria bacterium]NIT62869.1 DUF938 domain-containing protein [Gammaproteobacteria bacterium]NIV19834.1 DUF938 domain-containing protein [Gammaproteobacteria bacterium]NIY31449.1 DUF938 domain-containing protein [Gammaproteobacteria bacterium]